LLTKRKLFHSNDSMVVSVEKLKQKSLKSLKDDGQRNPLTSIALSSPSHFLHHVPHASPRHAAHRFHADAADCRHAAPAHCEDDEANSQRGAQRSHYLSTHPHPQEDSAGIDPPWHRSRRCHRSCRFLYCQEVLHRQDIAPIATTRKRVGGL